MKSPARQPESLLQAQKREAPEGDPVEMPPPPKGGGYDAEMRALKDPSFCASERWLSCQNRANRTGAHPDILEFEKRFMKRARKIGIPLFAHCVMRTSDEQNRLYIKGVSKARAGQSPHNYGLAVDIVHCTKAWDLSRKQWDLLGHIGKEVAAQLGVKIVWGGDWDFYDPAHWELRNWRDIGTKR